MSMNDPRRRTQVGRQSSVRGIDSANEDGEDEFEARDIQPQKSSLRKISMTPIPSKSFSKSIVFTYEPPKVKKYQPPVYRTYAPFGTRKPMGEFIGLHPGLDTLGTYKKHTTLLGPGYYNPEPIECCYRKYNYAGSMWSRKKNMEEFSKELGFRFPRLLDERKKQRMLNGPGSKDINLAYYTRESKSVLQGRDFGLQKRFRSIAKDYHPSPDRYFRNVMEHSTCIKRNMTPLPPFEWDGCKERLTRPEKDKWSLAPNRYDPVQEGAISAILKKQVSKRGPYDLFTGPRDMSTIKNHFTTSLTNPVNYFHYIPSEFEHMLEHPSKRRKGKFFVAERFLKKPVMRLLLDDLSLCYRDPKLPSPASYTLKSCFEKKPEGKFPFNSGMQGDRLPLKWTIFPGVGRYNVKTGKCKASKKVLPQYMFLSKVKREIFKVTNYRDY